MNTAAANHEPAPLHWTPPWRLLVFVLSATSIWCLLSDFYHLLSMRTFALAIMLPGTAALIALAAWDKVRGGAHLWRAVLIGAATGLLAAVAYDVFRLPFVYARPWHLAGLLPPLPLFKVFPRFGAMLLGQPIEQPHYSPAAQVLGWAYHFSNGLTFGVMYLALIGNGRRRSWAWAVVMAVGLELGMLLTPYPQTFGIRLTATFVAATLAAHLVFGVTLGLLARRWSLRWPATVAPVPA